MISSDKCREGKKKVSENNMAKPQKKRSYTALGRSQQVAEGIIEINCG